MLPVFTPGAALPRTPPPAIVPGPICILGPKPTAERNGCNLKPLKPEVPEKALLLVVSWRPLPLQVVCPSQPGFQRPKSPVNPGWDALARQATRRRVRTRLEILGPVIRQFDNSHQ